MGVKVKESKFQADLIREINDMFREVLVQKLDSSYTQGIPDLLILHPNGWAVLEVKRSINEPFQPNQEYYLNLLDQWSFAAMICPENKREVLNELNAKLSSRPRRSRAA
jgi:hypothetical protein